MKKNPKILSLFILSAIGITAGLISWSLLVKESSISLLRGEADAQQLTPSTTATSVVYPPLNKVAYDERMQKLANTPFSTTTATSTPKLWPPKTTYPRDGAILPFNRVIAYYGNLYSTKMGALGEYKKDEMFSRLKAEVKRWEQADPGTPVVPALHYIAVTAQGSAGKDGKYRLRMPDSEIDKVMKMASEINAIVFLDVQVAKSTIQIEMPMLEKYLKEPNVHFGIDPEFYMKRGGKPGEEIGTMDAVDINYAQDYLAKLVRDNNLPPKILVIHRFTKAMVTNYKNIKSIPEVQVVIHMDGWGLKARKENTYREFIYREPVQFAGFKLFYKNDFREKGSRIMTPEEILKLKPQPVYIQYQ